MSSRDYKIKQEISDSALDTSDELLDVQTNDDTTDNSDVTPRRRNKRKMSEPRRRTTDFSIRSLCQSSDSEESQDNTDKKENLNDTKEVKYSATIGSEKPQTFTGFNPYDLANNINPLLAANLSNNPAYSAAVNFQNFLPLVYGSHGLPPVWLYGAPGLVRPPIMPPYPHPTAIPTIDPHDSSRLAPVVVEAPGSSNVSMSSSSPRTLSRSQTHSLVPSTQRADSNLPGSPAPSSTGSMGDESGTPGGRGRSRKNYKNMTKQRRIEANARERTRVHTISAAFENLRRAVPSYSYNQRLSKLAILRIACSYIVALANLAEMDYSDEECQESFDDCVDVCTATIQSEGKTKRKH